MNSSSKPAPIRAAAVVLLAASLGGCYLLDSAGGQLALMSKRRPIAEVINDPKTPAALRAQLETVTSIREFAVHELDLPDNGSYRSYADVGRAYVVWNVVAAPEFSVEPKEWCFPIVGCVAYRGYFAESKARAFAGRLRDSGFDVSVGGVAAYSTLGHFDDPVLNTMMGWGEADLAGIIFHELTHQLVYVAGDAPFNEALATAVEEEGVRRWLKSRGREAELEAHLVQERQILAVVDLLRRTRSDLDALYGSGLEPGVMRERKRAAFAALRAEYERARAGFGPHPPFAAWFDGGLNNAELASIGTYYDCVPGLVRELDAAGGDLPAFYRRVRVLAALAPEARDAAVCAAPTGP